MLRDYMAKVFNLFGGKNAFTEFGIEVVILQDLEDSLQMTSVLFQ
jgi:hypothetical protein